MLKVDSHQHFWKFDPLRDSWITEDMQVLRDDFLPEDLQPLLEKNTIPACVAVQADQSDQETEFLLGLAEAKHFIKGVVGWVDLRSPDLADKLKYYSQFEKLKGFRHILQAEKEGFMLQPEFLRGIAALGRFGFSYDILIRAGQLREACRLVELHPNQQFVIDHLAKPDIRSGEIRQWAADISEIASYPNVYCKLSGMVTEADLRSWKPEHIYPFIDVAAEVFGPGRLMFGSDWPVCKLAAEYSEVCELVETYLAKFDSPDQAGIWGENAIEFYRLK